MLNPSPETREERLSVSVARKSLELMTAAFALVAALAWNDAVQSLFARVFGTDRGLLAKFLYAVLVTVVVVGIGLRLSHLTKKFE